MSGMIGSARRQVRQGYIGSRYADGRVYVGVIRDNCIVEPLHHHQLHSPGGFEWGYLGSGPADLARSMLIHAMHLCDHHADAIPPRLYQRFKEDMIAPLPRDDTWEIDRNDILEWLVAHADLIRGEWVREPG